MRGLISIYLDIFRFLAALGVFLSHAAQHSAAPGVLPAVPIDHKLVIIFFVISGYVITASASRPDRTLANYSADRIARLSSVVVPALLLTYVLDGIGSRFSPDLYSFIDQRWQSLRLLANLCYCQQIWFLCVNPSSNTPMWSLGYEFWYYVLFGALIFVRSKWAKILSLLVISAFIGPKILLLLPAWAIGSLAYHWRNRWQCPYGAAWLLFIVTGLATVLAITFEDQLGLSNGKSGQPPLYYSSNYGGDLIFALIVASHFVCCGMLSRHITRDLEPYKAVKFVRWMASHTFSLYLYHAPLLFFLRAITKYDPHNLYAVLAAMAGTLLIIAGLSKITEERYPVLRTWLRQWLGSFAPKPGLAATR